MNQTKMTLDDVEVLTRAMLRTAVQYNIQMGYLKEDNPKRAEIKRYYTQKLQMYLKEVEKLPKEEKARLYGGLIIMRDSYIRQEAFKRRTLQLAFAKECKNHHEAISRIFEIKDQQLQDEQSMQK